MDTPIDFLIRPGQAETTKALREHAAGKLSFALRRFHDQIRQITVCVVDVNGPKRGVVGFHHRGSVGGPRLFVDATAAWPFPRSPMRRADSAKPFGGCTSGIQDVPSMPLPSSSHSEQPSSHLVIRTVRR